MRIVAAGNTEAPALAVLKAIGVECSVERELVHGRIQVGGTCAEMIGHSFLEILGLWVILEKRGEDWAPTDQEVEAFLSTESVSGGK